MFILVWTVGYMIGGIPHLDKIPDGVMDRANCEGHIILYRERMADFVRGKLAAGNPEEEVDLEFSIGIYGQCLPVERKS